MRHFITITVFAFFAFSHLPANAEEKITKTWAIAEFGEPLYKDGIEHWPYVNPDAPKGGKIILGAYGTFDSLNTYILKGDWAAGIGLIADSLMVGSDDELSSAYGLIAETVEYPDDKSWIIFNLRPQARYHDGSPITADDFVFGFNVIREHGRPFLQSFYEEIESVEALETHRLKVSFKTRDNMKPLLKAAGLQPEPKHYWQDRDITKTYLEPPLSSGPYRIADIDPGRSITYQRVPDYWAKDLPVNRGTNNFEIIRYEYYRDLDVMFEAFRAGELDFRAENSSKRWATGYDIPQVADGQIIKRTHPDNTPRGIQAFFFNLRRPQFADVRVRQGISYLYDFETLRRTVMYDQYVRIDSFFPGSDFGASGPPTAEEIAVLEPYREQLPAEIFSKPFELPQTDGRGNIRNNLRQALQLFKAAGWGLEDGKLVKDGQQMKIEFLLRDPNFERNTAPYVANLQRAGIDASIRIVDTAQYRVRLDDFDFDMTTVFLNFFPPPGPELRSYYGSAAADIRGSANMAGIKNPVVDELIEKIVNAKDLEMLKLYNRAMDRVLLWNHYVVPQYRNDVYRLAYWNRFAFPQRSPKYGTGFPGSWWLDKELDAKLSLKR